MHYSHLQPMSVWILLILCFSAALALPEIQDMRQIRGTEVDENSEEYENALVKNVRDSYRNGFVELVNFVNSINNTFNALKADLASQKEEISRQRADIQDLQYKIAVQKVAISHQEGVIGCLNYLQRYKRDCSRRDSWKFGY